MTGLMCASARPAAAPVGRGGRAAFSRHSRVSRSLEAQVWRRSAPHPGGEPSSATCHERARRPACGLRAGLSGVAAW